MVLPETITVDMECIECHTKPLTLRIIARNLAACTGCGEGYYPSESPTKVRVLAVT